MIVWINGPFGVGKTSVASELARRLHGALVLTLVVRDHFIEIVGALRRSGVDIRHFTLLASRERILGRHRARDDYTVWGEQQLDGCLAALHEPAFAVHLDTEDKSPEGIGREIATGIAA